MDRDISLANPTLPRPSDTDGIGRLIRSDDDIAFNKNVSKRHTRMVRWMRLLLPVVALGFIAILMSLSGHESQVAPVPREKILPASASRNELIHPKFQSEDDKSQPYTITADKAIQNTEKMDDILLEKPVADMTLNNKGWVSIKASKGVYNQASGNLNLDGKVEVHHDSGYELNSEKMFIDVKAKTITSSTPVNGHGPAADIEASGMDANDADKVITFIGPARLILRQDSAKTAQPH